jgi:hypothetical protein
MANKADEHPFWVEGMGWVQAGSLQPGWLVRLKADGYAVVGSSTRQMHTGGITVYNLEVAGHHTYFVEDGFGEQDAVWVHNTCPIRNQPRPGRDIPGQIRGQPHHPTATLIKNMEKAGVPYVSGASPHHIVPGGSASAGRARAVLDKHNIDINQADNGVYLAPPGKPSPDPTLSHGSTFSHQRYGEAVSERMENADLLGGKSKVLDELAAIRDDLLEGRMFWEIPQ